MRVKKVVASLIASGLMFGALAIGFAAPRAQGEHEHCGPDGLTPEQYIAEHDADGNGTLSREEFPGPDHAFARVDADGNGEITQDEAAAAAQTRHERKGLRGERPANIDPKARWDRMLEHSDVNGDGVIAEAEFNGPEHAFARLDANGDGMLTREEVLSAATRVRQRMEDGQGRGQVAPQLRWERMLERFDTDGNGVISEAEFNGPEHAFARLDVDGNGEITAEEALAAGANRRQGQRDGAGRGQGNGRGGAQQQ